MGGYKYMLIAGVGEVERAFQNASVGWKDLKFQTPATAFHISNTAEGKLTCCSSINVRAFQFAVRPGATQRWTACYPSHPRLLPVKRF